MVEYYDYILLAIPLVTFVTVGGLLLAGVDSQTATAGGGVASTGLVIYALFFTLPHQTDQHSTSMERGDAGKRV